MLGYFDEASMPPEVKFIFNEMKKLAAENATLRERVATLEANQENLRKAINKVAKEGSSPKYVFDPKDSLFTDPLPAPVDSGPMSWLERFFPKKRKKK